MKNIKKLSDIQRIVHETVRSSSLSQELAEIIVEKPPISIKERIGIYQDAYHIRLTESLRDDFSRVLAQVTAKQWEDLVNNYVEKTPSRFRNLAEYSEDFPEFLKIQKPEVYLEGVKDWMEILSLQAPEAKKEMGLKEIQEGTPFSLKIHPATVPMKLSALTGVNPELHWIAYRENENIQFLDVTESLFDLLSFFSTEKSLEEVGHFAKERGFEDQVLLTTVSDWIQKKILYCQSV